MFSSGFGSGVFNSVSDPVFLVTVMDLVFLVPTGGFGVFDSGFGSGVFGSDF